MNTENKWFTIYWQHNDRSFLNGPTIEAALSNAGYGDGNLHATYHCEEGITSSYWRDPVTDKWVKKKQSVVSLEDIKNGIVGEDVLTELIKTSTEVAVKVSDHDMVVIRSGYGLYNVNTIADMVRTQETKLQWVKYLEVFYLEYTGEDDDGVFGYHVMATNHFQHDDYKNAVAHFIYRLTGPKKPYDGNYAVKGAMSIDEIAAAQSSIPK